MLSEHPVCVERLQLKVRPPACGRPAPLSAGQKEIDRLTDTTVKLMVRDWRLINVVEDNGFRRWCSSSCFTVMTEIHTLYEATF